MKRLAAYVNPLYKTRDVLVLRAAVDSLTAHASLAAILQVLLFLELDLASPCISYRLN